MTILRRIWKYGKWPVVVLALAYVALVIYEIPAVRQKDMSDAAVARIHAQKLTMADVDGKHLPPPPDPDLVDATVEGIDANGNGIRDDVELAIFKKYPDDIKLRAAELQYAKSLQREFADVFDVPTLANVVNEEGRGFLCVADDNKSKEVENLVFNTSKRIQYREDIRQKYMSSFELDSNGECDLSFG